MVQNSQFYRHIEKWKQRSFFFFLKSTRSRKYKIVISGWGVSPYQKCHMLGQVLLVHYIIWKQHCYFIQISIFWVNWGKWPTVCPYKTGDGVAVWRVLVMQQKGHRAQATRLLGRPYATEITGPESTQALRHVVGTHGTLWDGWKLPVS